MTDTAQPGATPTIGTHEAPRPDGPGGITAVTLAHKPSWLSVLRRTILEFADDSCTDLAAALTYYAVLAIFPALIALVSILGLVGQGQSTTDALLDVVDELAPGVTPGTIRTLVEGLASNQSAGLVFAIGLLGALWSASGYVGAFSRAMNRIYEVAEGRPVWVLRPVMLLVTVAMLVLVALGGLVLALSGPVARAVGEAVGLESTVIDVWSIAKWPVLALVVMLVVGILYRATPNVRQPRFRWISSGAFLAILTWVIASAGFGVYVANFPKLDTTYGSLAAAVVFLLWLWITNLALLFGAEYDAERERARELGAGLPAEATIQLAPRDTRASRKRETRARERLERDRERHPGPGRAPDATTSSPSGRRRAAQVDGTLGDLGHRGRHDGGSSEK